MTVGESGNTDELLDQSKFVYEKGLTVTGLTKTGISTLQRTGSVRETAKAIIVEYAMGKLPPRTGKDLLERASISGIAVFRAWVEKEIQRIRDDQVGDGYVAPAGPTTHRTV